MALAPLPAIAADEPPPTEPTTTSTTEGPTTTTTTVTTTLPTTTLPATAPTTTEVPSTAAVPSNTVVPTTAVDPATVPPPTEVPTTTLPATTAPETSTTTEPSAPAPAADANTVTGTVVGPAGPIDFVNVELWTEFAFYETTTDATGRFTIGDLPDDSYRAYFSAPSHVPEWWQDATSYGSATPIALGGGATVDLAVELESAATLSGHVRDQFGNPVSDLRVTADGAGSSPESWTDFDGAFQIVVAPGTYTLRIEDGSGRYRTEWWQDAFSADVATPITVAGGNTLTFDFAVDPIPEGTASLGGTVTDEDTGEPLPFVSVTLRGPENSNTFTDELGRYSFAGLDAGEYQLWFEDFGGVHVTEYWEDVTDSSLATPIVLEDDESFTADAALARRPVGTITGTVTDETTGEPLTSVSVVLLPEFEFTSTDSLGQYTFERVDAGTHQISFSDFNGVYTSEYWDNMTNEFDATPVVVADGVTFTADAALTPRQVGTITGTVTSDLTGDPIPLITVVASGPENESTTTDDSGRYAFEGLAVGQYEVTFSDFSSSRYRTEWWDDATDPSGATPVLVEPAATTTVNAALALRPGVGTASISGIVTTSLGDPLPGVSVYVTGPASGDGYTDDSGHYTITDLPAGDYTVLFVDNAAFEYQFEWWDDAASETEATPVSVADGAHVDGIDASLDKMDAAFISGQVSGADGDPIEGIRVVAQSTGSGSGDIATTAGDGTYTLEVSAGEFVIGFEPPGDTPWFAEFYDNAFDVVEASIVSVAAGEARTGIDAHLDRAGLITGRVTAGGEPAADVHVTGSSTGGLVEAWTNADGVYALVVPNPGAYRLRFERPGDDLRPEWFDDARQVGDSTPVSVELSTTVSGIDVDLEPGGSISGRVTDTAGEPVAGLSVVASGGGTSSEATTDGDGRYTIDGLDGSVVLTASPGWGSEFAPRYWPDAPSFESAGAIVVDGDVDLIGYDITVRRLGSITGTVSSPDGPTPNARVVLHPTGDGVGQTVWTSEDGRYSFEQLGLGDYVVEFTEAAEQHLLGEHWSGAPDRASATVLSITDGERFEHIDADLDPAGVLSGRVTDEAGDPVPFLQLVVSGSLSGAAVFTDADGRYEARVRPAPGTVRVVGDDVVNATHEYASVAPGDAGSLDFVVASGVSLVGSLVAPDGMYVASAEVFVYSLDGHGLAGVLLWGPGGYEFAHLPVGEVEIRVSVYACAAQCISVQFRETISLTAGANTFDFVIPEPGGISGRVTDDVGGPVANRAVLACVDESGCVNQYTDDDGRFVFDGLLPMAYEVRAVEIVDPWVEIRTVTVEPGAVSTADFVVPRLVTVTGTLRSSSGTPMATGAVVSARDRDTGEVIQYGDVGVDGMYELSVASGADVAVCAEPTDAYGGITGGGFECWDNAASVGAATPLNGSPGSVLSDIDFTLGGPSVIEELEALVDGDSATLAWNAPLYTGGRSITDYIVQIDSGDGVWSTYDDGISTARTVTASELEPGAAYRFRVAAVNAFGVGVASTPVSVEIPPTVPSAPLLLTATRTPGPGGRPEIVLAWDPPADDGGADVVDYVIQRSPNGRAWTTIDDGTSLATTYTVTRADAGTGSRFRVVAVNEVGAGPPSEVVNART